VELFKEILPHNETVPSGAVYNEDIEVTLSDDGSLLIFDNANGEGSCYLYKPQVVKLLQFLYKHVELFRP
jgi:hypothetical protein